MIFLAADHIKVLHVEVFCFLQTFCSWSNYTQRGFLRQAEIESCEVPRYAGCSLQLNPDILTNLKLEE